MSGFRIAAAMIVVATVYANLTGVARAEEALTADQKKAVEELVRQYILDNPNVLIESMRRMDQKRKAEEKAKVSSAIKSRKKELLEDPDAPFAGPKDSDVVIVEFFDYHCGVCKRVLPIVQKMLKSDAKVKLVYKEWPILGPASVTAARAALASHKQGKYIPFHNAMMKANGRLTKNRILAIATGLGMDPVKLEKDMKAREIDSILSRNLQLSDAITLNGTPSFIIGNTLIRGGRSYDSMMGLIRKERARVKNGGKS